MTIQGTSTSGRVDSSSVVFRPVRFEDYPQIAALQKRNGLDTKPREEWEDLWKRNPEYRKFPQWPIGFVIENSENTIVGYTAWIPLSYHFEGRELSSASGWGMAVDMPYRGHTPALMRRVVNPDTGEFLLDASAKPNVARILDKTLERRGIGGRIPAGDWDNAWFWITNYQGFTASAITARKFPSILSYPAAFAMWVRDQARGGHSWAKDKHPELEVCSNFDERFDVFWEELKRTYPNRLLATRSREVLEWHFRYAMKAGKVWIVAIRDKGKIAAYSIFRRQDNRSLNLTRMRLIDFQSLNPNNRLVIPTLAWALGRCREERIHMLEAYGFRADKQRVINSLSPLRRPLPAWCFFYVTFNAELRQKLKNPDLWDPSHFDGDESL